MYYPEQRSASPLTVIRREVMLPEEAVGVVRTTEGKRVDVRDIIANGVKATGYVILDGAGFFGLKKPEALKALMLVERGDVVEPKKAIAGKNANRGKRLYSPITGVLAQVIDGLVILQEMPEVIDLEAGVRGKISEVQPGRGVVIEAVGAHIQGVWGNNRRIISNLRIEPDGGLNSVAGDVLEVRFNGAVVVTKQALTATSFAIMQEQNFAGIIAPSMDSSLRSLALKMEGVVVLTAGFGNIRMSSATFSLLQEFDGSQVTIDAAMPDRWETRFPEIIVNRAVKEGQRPSKPNPMLMLRNGTNVRISRDPYNGLTGRVVDLPKSPVLLENGLRVLSAQVELITGDTVFVPLENLEVMGR